MTSSQSGEIQALLERSSKMKASQPGAGDRLGREGERVGARCCLSRKQDQRSAANIPGAFLDDQKCRGGAPVGLNHRTIIIATLQRATKTFTIG
jgi:hypothetical protein